MCNSWSPNDIAAQVSLTHFFPPRGFYPPITAFPPELADVAQYVAQECHVGLGWAAGAVLATLGIAIQGTITVHLDTAFEVPVLPAFLLMGERGSGKDRTLQLVLRTIRLWEKEEGASLLSARRSYVQQMRQTFEQGGFSAIVDGELDSLSSLFSHPDHRGEILDELEGNGRGYVSQRCAFTMTNAKMALLSGAQPTVLQEKIRRYRMEENGFLSRCCIINNTAPAWISTLISQEVFERFEKRLLALLEYCHEIRKSHSCTTLAFAPDALSVWRETERYFQSWTHPRRALLEGWLSRALAHTAKLAAILALYAEPTTQAITPEMAYRASEMGKWLLEETCVAYDFLFPMPGVRAAVISGRYLQQMQLRFVSDKHLKLALAKDIATTREIKAGISLLLSIGAFQPGTFSGGKPGHPESGYHVNVQVLWDFLNH